MMLQVGVIWALVFAPPIAILLGLALGLAPLWVAGAAAISMHLIFSVFSVTKLHAKSFALLLFPAGMLLITFMMLRAGYKCLKNNGIDWRGTHYSLEQLRAGQRIKF
jgi:hypothetical protein